MSFEDIEIPEGLHGELRRVSRKVWNEDDFDAWLDCEMFGLMHQWDPSWSYAPGVDQPAIAVLVTAEVAFTLSGIAIATRRREVDVVAAVAARVLEHHS